jgi:hypothetical protein
VTSELRVSFQAAFVSVAGKLVACVERRHYTSVCRRDYWYRSGSVVMGTVEGFINSHILTEVWLLVFLISA